MELPLIFTVPFLLCSLGDVDTRTTNGTNTLWCHTEIVRFSILFSSLYLVIPQILFFLFDC